MKKLGKSRLYSFTILGMLTMFLISSGIYVSCPTNQFLQKCENSPITLHTTAENMVWNTTWGGANSDWGYGVAVDANGSVYCDGYTYSFGVGGDFALVKVAPNGTLLWNTTWGGLSEDIGYDMTIDASGAVYCVGYTVSFGEGFPDFALVKFAPNGTLLWNATWGGANWDICEKLAVDANGNIYCVGYTKSFGMGSWDFALVKFAPNGTLLWNTTWGGADSDCGYGVALDASGFIYCVGSTNTFGAGEYDLALVKFAPNGTRLWNTTWGGADSEVGKSIVKDASGAIYCVGMTNSFGANGDFALVKFAPNGTQLWNTTWGGADQDQGFYVAVDASGAIYCVGMTNSFGANGDFALVKFAPTGTLLWNTTWGGADSDWGWGVTVDASGAIYCVGITNSFGANGDFALVKFIRLEAPILDTISPAIDADGNITLNWDDVLGAEKYYIYRELSPITSIAGLQPKYEVLESQYNDTLTIETTYYYVIVAAAGSINSSISNCENVTFSISGGIPGFEGIYLLSALVALVYLAQRRNCCRSTPYSLSSFFHP